MTEKNDKDEEVHPDPLTASINRYTVDEATDYQEIIIHFLKFTNRYYRFIESYVFVEIYNI